MLILIWLFGSGLAGVWLVGVRFGSGLFGVGRLGLVWIVGFLFGCLEHVGLAGWDLVCLDLLF